MITLEGTIEEIVYANEINGYTVCELSYKDGLCTAVGHMPFINIGETIKITGNWITHPDYGEQLKVEAYEKLLPETAQAIEKYLGSGIVKGVGPATAGKIVKRFGSDTLNIIQLQPLKLAEVKGISAEKAIKIGQAFDEQRELRAVVMFFQEYGISPAYSMKIYKVFGERTIEEISSNPYRLVDEIFGIGFKIADRIAMSMGIEPQSRYRVCSGIKYVLSQAAGNGHTYFPENKLREYTSQLLEVNIEGINDALISLTLDNSIHVEKTEDGNRCYLSAFYNAELGVCRKLAELSYTNFEGDLKDFDKIIEEVQVEEDIILAENQKLAVREALVNGVLVITGGPGTGKTTIIKTIINLLNKEGYEVVLAAPTGRAAKRMSEATGYDAKTIHRLLEIGFNGSENEMVFARTDTNPIEADVIIIDEMSMVDILIMNHLLKAIEAGTRLILVGDVDQLPSVGAGNVLKDIIKSDVIKTVKLSEVFRQAEESMIVVNAHRINKGEQPYLNRKDKDFFFMPRHNGQGVLNTILELCRKRLPKAYGYDPMRHIQVLSPTKKGTIGTINLNMELQSILNPQDKNKNEKPFRGIIFREGDRVMQIKNNYNLRWEKADGTQEGVGVFNGDTGIITKIDDDEEKIEVVFEDDRLVEYDYSILDEIDSAFAVTIHKSQGSEFPVVLLPLFTGPQVLMTRNLLYTGITRAKELVILVGSEGVMQQMINNERETLRYSSLSEKLIACFHGLNS